MLNSFYEHKQLQVQYFISKYLSDVPHFHKELELIYVIDGVSEAIVDKNVYQLNKGDILLTFPNQIHFYDTKQYGQYICLVFSPDIIIDMKRVLVNNVPEKNVISIDDNSQVYKILEDLKDIISPEKYSQTLAGGYLNIIMNYILEDFKLEALGKANVSLTKSILEYCSSHYTEELSLDILAQDLHSSKYHISHVFNKNLRMSFNDYINYLRISSAADLLKTTDLTITEIGQTVGFGTTRSFNSAFLKIKNCTPSQHRKIKSGSKNSGM